MLENVPKTKLELLANEIAENLKLDTKCEKVNLLKSGHYKFIPGKVLQIEFNHPEKGQTITTVNFDLEGENKNEFVFAHMTTLPDENKSLGFGSVVINSIIKTLSTHSELKFIRAVQVQKHAESFWERLGFVLGRKLELPCSAGGLMPACTDSPILIFGFITIPFMGIMVFGSILLITLLIIKNKYEYQ